MGLFGGDIQLCPSGGDVELCLERDIELCTTCPVLTLTGSDEPVVGTEYTATGGSGDLTFSFDKGSISITSTTPATTTEPRKVVATITAINNCGASGTDRTGVVSVSDSCDPVQTASITVRLPNGTWVFSHWEHENGCSDSATYDQTCCEADAMSSCCCDYLGMGIDAEKTGTYSSPAAMFYRYDNTAYKLWLANVAMASCHPSGDCPSQIKSLSCQEIVDSAYVYPFMDAVIACMESTFRRYTETEADLINGSALYYKSLSNSNQYVAIAKQVYVWKCP